MNKLDQLCLKAYAKMCLWKEEVKDNFKEECGAVNMIEIVVIIVIVLLVAVALKDTLNTVMSNVMEQLKTFVGVKS